MEKYDEYSISDLQDILKAFEDEVEKLEKRKKEYDDLLEIAKIIREISNKLDKKIIYKKLNEYCSILSTEDQKENSDSSYTIDEKLDEYANKTSDEYSDEYSSEDRDLRIKRKLEEYANAIFSEEKIERRKTENEQENDKRETKAKNKLDELIERIDNYLETGNVRELQREFGINKRYARNMIEMHNFIKYSQFKQRDLEFYDEKNSGLSEKEERKAEERLYPKYRNKFIKCETPQYGNQSKWNGMIKKIYSKYHEKSKDDGTAQHSEQRIWICIMQKTRSYLNKIKVFFASKKLDEKSINDEIIMKIIDSDIGEKKIRHLNPGIRKAINQFELKYKIEYTIERYKKMKNDILDFPNYGELYKKLKLIAKYIIEEGTKKEEIGDMKDVRRLEEFVEELQGQQEIIPTTFKTVEQIVASVTDGRETK